MSEDKDKKTEEPTQKRLDDAKKKGQVPKSKEIVSTASLLFASVYFYFSWENHLIIIQELITLPAKYFTLDFDVALRLVLVTIFMTAFKLLMIPIIIVTFLAAIMFNIFQFGFILAFDPISPKMNKISPASGFSRIFSMKSVLDNVMALLKIILICVVVVYVVYSSIHEFPHNAIECDLHCFRSFFQATVLKLMSLLIPLFFLLSIIDYMLQKHEFIKNQRMSKEEAKMEYKQTQGDPFVKSVRKSTHIQAMNDDFLDRMKQTRLVITDYNYAITIAYDSDRMLYPVVLSIGKGIMLTKVLSVARSEQIPIVNDAPLTNMLVNDGEVDRYIPQSCIEKIATLLRGLKN